MTPRARFLIDHLNLQPHPEGGFYAEVYRSVRQVRADGAPAKRCALTSIYFLLLNQGVSRWHRVSADEVWCHLEGAPLDLHQLDMRPAVKSEFRSLRLGPVGEQSLPQATVPSGVWQAAVSSGDYTLAACQVAPGFEFADFELASADDPMVAWLKQCAPALAHLI